MKLYKLAVLIEIKICIEVYTGNLIIFLRPLVLASIIFLRLLVLASTVGLTFLFNGQEGSGTTAIVILLQNIMQETKQYVFQVCTCGD